MSSLIIEIHILLAIFGLRVQNIMAFLTNLIGRIIFLPDFKSTFTLIRNPLSWLLYALSQVFGLIASRISPIILKARLNVRFSPILTLSWDLLNTTSVIILRSCVNNIVHMVSFISSISSCLYNACRDYGF